MIKILNLYAGIGGNRKLWPNEKIEVTAIEYNEDIAAIYKKLYPSDIIYVTDAHQYLLEHYKEFDFIWSSPPCPTHSRFNLPLENKRYPDMKLYQEIIFLKWFFKKPFVVENVISYYNPLIRPYTIDGHFFWSNKILNNNNNNNRDLINKSKNDLAKEFNFDLTLFDYYDDVELLLRNCVSPNTGLNIFNQIFRTKQNTL